MKLDAIDLLNELAESCPRSNDAGFWILTSAAAYLANQRDDDASSVETYFPEWSKRQ